TETLDVLAANGIKFTILAPRQAKRIRKRGSRSWQDVSGDRVDPSRAYLLQLPSKRTMTVFFYDGPISQGVAFERLLDNGQRFADRLMSGFSDARTWPQLVHIATDGESYGHHHRFGEMALSYALHHVETDKLAQLTNYGEFLERHPPDTFVEVVNNSSWSCVHGVERWRANCGCNSGGHPGWTQEWRAPLRAALDWLRDQLAPLYEQEAGRLLKDPWAARDEYVQVVLNRSEESVLNFLGQHATHSLTGAEQVAALKLLEMQRHAMLMYTSCGWFFDELSGLETVQVMQYAGRVIQLARETGDVDLEAEFLEQLAQAKSNLPEFGDGAAIYHQLVRPAFVDLCKVGAHFAISSMFDGNHVVPQYCYDIRMIDYQHVEAGAAKLALGRAHVISSITRESSNLSFAAVYLGEQVLHAGVRKTSQQEEHAQLAGESMAAFTNGDFVEALRLLDDYFDEMRYSLKSLFKDEQKRILDIVLSRTLQDAEASYHKIYEKHGSLLRFLKEMGQPVPDVLRFTAEFVLNNDLKHTFENDPVDFVRAAMLVELVKHEGVPVDAAGVGFAASNSLTRLLRRLQQNPGDSELLERANVLATIFPSMPFAVNYWHAQNIYYSMLKEEFSSGPAKQDAASRAWRARFLELGEKLQISVPALAPEAELKMAS
ncbi:MAG TPA: DUF3536 domain-containing protein, partial [Candidatus Angelobacter sp.]|nr:DUF3536 domain-containing protein [Candidatus Angelobacter sp.]